MAKFSPAEKSAPTVDDVRADVKGLVELAEAILKTVAVVERARHHDASKQHLLNRISVVLQDATIALTHALSEQP